MGPELYDILKEIINDIRTLSRFQYIINGKRAIKELINYITEIKDSIITKEVLISYFNIVRENPDLFQKESGRFMYKTYHVGDMRSVIIIRQDNTILFKITITLDNIIIDYYKTNKESHKRNFTNKLVDKNYDKINSEINKVLSEIVATDIIYYINNKVKREGIISIWKKKLKKY